MAHYIVVVAFDENSCEDSQHRNLLWSGFVAENSTLFFDLPDEAAN